MSLRGSNRTLVLWPMMPSSGMSRAKMRDRGAVLRRVVVEVIDRAQRARARHVLHHDGRIARNVAPDMARDQPAIDVVAAAGPIADDQVDLPALVEIGDRIGARPCSATVKAVANTAKILQHASSPRPTSLAMRLSCKIASLYTGRTAGPSLPHHKIPPQVFREVFMKRWLAGLFVLLSPSAFAQSTSAPEIQFDSVPNFIKLPQDMHLGEASGVAVNSKGNGLRLQPRRQQPGSRLRQHRLADPGVRPRTANSCARSARTSTPGHSRIRCASTRTTISGRPTRART